MRLVEHVANTQEITNKYGMFSKNLKETDKLEYLDVKRHNIKTDIGEKLLQF
jgi:hypothetical protein